MALATGLSGLAQAAEKRVSVETVPDHGQVWVRGLLRTLPAVREVKIVLTHSFAGSAYPASRAQGGWPGYERDPETDVVTGAFRVVEDDGALIVIGNGEDPEKFWKVDCDEWAERAEGHAPGRCSGRDGNPASEEERP
jgi:hypothetical protein